MATSNRVVVTVQHPGHVHFFKNAIDELERQGYDVAVFAREKDVTCALLDAYGIDYETLAGSADSLPGLAKVQATYEFRILRRVRRLDPDVMLAIGEPAIAHASRVVDGHSVLFTDTEHATVQNAIAFPFADLVCTPTAFWGEPNCRRRTYRGYHELAYLHPNRFTPDPEIRQTVEAQFDTPITATSTIGAGSATATGADIDGSLVVMRLVSWNAAHDIGQAGIDGIERLVAELERVGATVLLSAEGELPPSVADRRIDLPPDRIHDLLAHADLFVGESATMAIESSVLGTPSLYVSDLYAGVLEELETRYRLLRSHPRGTEPAAIADTARELLTTDESTWERRRQLLLDECVDTTSFIVDTVERVIDG